MTAFRVSGLGLVGKKGYRGSVGIIFPYSLRTSKFGVSGFVALRRRGSPVSGLCP